MADSNGAAVDVQLGRIETQLLSAGDRLDAERLVDFKKIDVILGEASYLQHVLNGRHRAVAHDLGWHADCRVSNEPGKRCQVQLRGSLLGAEQHGGRTVADALREREQFKIIALVVIK